MRKLNNKFNFLQCIDVCRTAAWLFSPRHPTEIAIFLTSAVMEIFHKRCETHCTRKITLTARVWNFYVLKQFYNMNIHERKYIKSLFDPIVKLCIVICNKKKIKGPIHM